MCSPSVIEVLYAFEHAPGATAVGGGPTARDFAGDPVELVTDPRAQRLRRAHVLAARQGALAVQLGRYAGSTTPVAPAPIRPACGRWSVCRQIPTAGAPATARQRQGVVAGDGRRVVGLVVAQRTNAGIAVQDIATADLLFEVGVDHLQQVIGFGLGDRHFCRITGVLAVGGADQGEVIEVWNGERRCADLRFARCARDRLHRASARSGGCPGSGECRRAIPFSGRHE